MEDLGTSWLEGYECYRNLNNQFSDYNGITKKFPFDKDLSQRVFSSKTENYINNFKKAFDQLSEKNAVKYVKSVEELVETIKILSNHSKANNMGQRGLKYVNSLNDETFRIASTINTFL